MKIIIIKSNLRDGLTAVQSIAGDKQDLPILKNVLIESFNNKISLTTTNLELAITFFVFGKTIEPGKTTVPVGIFSNLANNLSSERLNIELRGKKLEVKTDNYEAGIQTLPTDDFPIIPKIKDTKKQITIEGRFLKEALNQVISSAQASDLRPELNTVLFSFSLDHLTITATDSFRLAEKTIPKTNIKVTNENPFRVLVPLRTAQELSKIVQDNDKVEIYHDDNQVMFKCERFEMISRLIDGAFPDYEYLVPKKFDTEAVVNREEFLGALKLAGVFSSRVSEVHLKTVEKRALEIVSNDQALGDNKYLLPAKVVGSTKDVGFNWRFLVDGLKNIKTDDVFVGLNEDNKPALLRSPNDASYYYILMPILRA